MARICLLTIVAAGIAFGSPLSAQCCGAGGCAKKVAAAAKDGAPAAKEAKAGCGKCEGKCAAAAKDAKDGKATAACEKCSKASLVAVKCPVRAQALAAQIRGTADEKKSGEILAAAIPEIKCPVARAKLIEDVKAGKSDKDAGQMILVAIKDLKPEAPAAKDAKDAPAGAAKCEGKCPGKCGAGAKDAQAAGKSCCGAAKVADAPAPAQK